jgi:hypothetical protein
MYSPERMLQDYAERTLKNITCIKSIADERPAEAFEVTEMINALLGIIVFPQQIGIAMVPNQPLSLLLGGAWPQSVLSMSIEFTTLQHLLHRMRNSIAHGNIVFTPNNNNEIECVTFYGKYKRNGKHRKWEMPMPVSEMSTFVAMLCELFSTSQAHTRFMHRAVPNRH